METMELTDTLKQWVEVDSCTDNLSGLSEMTAMLKKAFAPLGGTVDEIELAPRTEVNEKGEKISRPLGKALRIRKRANAKKQVFLAGHMDTVSRKHKGASELEGVGVADMKGGLLVLLQGLLLFEESEEASRLGWEVLIVPDEEIGSPGSSFLFEEAAKKYDCALLFEPSLPDGSLVSARKGSFNATVTARGKSAHAGREFYEGRNAVTALARFAVEAEGLSNKNSGITVNIGRMEGGGATNVVPDFALLRLNVRMQHPEQVQKVKRDLNTIIEKIEDEKKVSLELTEDSLRPPKLFDAPTQTLFEALKATGSELGIGIKWRETGGACDGNTLSALGLPTIDTLGVIGGNLHTEQEYIEPESLRQRIRLLAAFLEKIASGKIKLSKGKT